MKIYLLVSIVLFTSCQTKQVSKASKTDCEKFRTGSFLHESQGDPLIYKIERRDSVQTEIVDKTGNHVNLRISWTGACSYELTFLDQHINNADSISDIGKALKVKVDIVDVRNDTCFVIADNGVQKLPGIVYIDKK